MQLYQSVTTKNACHIFGIWLQTGKWSSSRASSVTALSSTVQLALYLLKIAATAFATSRLGSSRATWPTRPSLPIDSAASARVSCTRGLASVSTVAAFYRRLNAREGILYLRPGVHDRRSTFVLAIPAALISGSPAKSSCGLTPWPGFCVRRYRFAAASNLRGSLVKAFVPAVFASCLLSAASPSSHRRLVRARIFDPTTSPSPAVTSHLLQAAVIVRQGFCTPASFMWLLNTSAALACLLLLQPSDALQYPAPQLYLTGSACWLSLSYISRLCTLSLPASLFAVLTSLGIVLLCSACNPSDYHSFVTIAIPDACFPPPLLSLHGRVLIPAVFTHCRPFLLLSLREGVLVPTAFAFGPAVSSFRYSAPPSFDGSRARVLVLHTRISNFVATDNLMKWSLPSRTHIPGKTHRRSCPPRAMVATVTDTHEYVH
ncbi:hypothetical protein C8J57DRAFT_1530429 [Mycena rebaudengoi]|nr:hypothetical protein C8J57DRAFT_1530429 [Mycena rebaudengoi]